MKLLFKNTIKKIKKSLGRFISITVIIALGVSFFIGLRESTPGILYTVDNYYDNHNLMDFKIISTKGLTKGDVSSLKELSNVDRVIPSYSVDVLINGEAIRIHSFEDEVNNVNIVKGREIKNNNECLADSKKYSLEDEIKFSNDLLRIKKCKVVGLIKSPLYITEDKGLASIGNGKLESYIYILEDNFNSDYYTEIYLIGKNTKGKHSYYEEYENIIKNLRDELSIIKPIRETIRYEEILKEANKIIDKEQEKIDREIKKNLKKLYGIKSKLDNARNKLNKEKNKLKIEKDNLLENKNTIEIELNFIGTSINDLDNFINNMDTNILNLEQQLSLLNNNTLEYQILLEKINNLKVKVNKLKELKSNIKKIDSSLLQIEDASRKLDAQNTKLNYSYGEYYQNYEKLKNEEKTVENKIKEAREDLKKLERPEWYLLDRTENIGYSNFKDEVLRVEAISRFLPLFFVVVAMLVATNTLSRMIEEERGELGILRSNGFSNISIIISYLIYISIAAIIGLIFGFTIGYSLIPRIIYGVFLSRYYVPTLITIISPLPFSLVIFLTLILMMFVVIIALKHDLKEEPANLLRPKLLKKGKKVFFEKTIIWKKLNFLWKITIRNLFRFPKRVIMTILGVGGCTALLLTGFGLNNSINKITKLQYENIIKYDSMYILKNKVDKIDDKVLKLFIENEVVNPILVYQDNLKYKYENKSANTYLMVPKDPIIFNNYVNLVDKNKKMYIEDNCVLITRQMAEFMKVKVGDLIEIRDKNNHLYYLKLGNIVDNYVANYIYMSPKYYSEVFLDNVKYNTIIASGNLKDNIKLSDYGILTKTNTKDIINSFDELINGLNMIIIMIIVLAGFLALSVLYNLTVINISERIREIATLKVLGFNDKEISMFIYRESLLLTFMGILFGLLIGKYFHIFIISFAQTDNIRFSKDIGILSFFLSIIITITFSLMVQLFINKSLKQVDMIESLKSVE